MSDNISVPISEESITVTISEGVTWDGISGKPTAVSGSSFIVSDSSPFNWLVKTLTEVKTILGLGSAAYESASAFAASGHNQSVTTITPVAVQTAPFAIPLAIDVTTYKDWKCTNVSGDTTVNITGESDGDAGMIETYNSASGVITLGTMFTKNAGGGVLESAVSGDNIIAWTKSGIDIIYSISSIE